MTKNKWPYVNPSDEAPGQFIRGIAVVFGARDPRPIVNIPPGAIKVRLRLRNTATGKAFIRFPDRVEQWLLMPEDETTINHPNWKLGRLLGVNVANPLLAKQSTIPKNSLISQPLSVT
jgi:hypothetical protein